MQAADIAWRLFNEINATSVMGFSRSSHFLTGTSRASARGLSTFAVVASRATRVDAGPTSACEGPFECCQASRFR